MPSSLTVFTASRDNKSAPSNDSSAFKLCGGTRSDAIGRDPLPRDERPDIEPEDEEKVSVIDPTLTDQAC